MKIGPYFIGNSLVEKQDVSVKHLQEVFNFKYSMRFYSIYLPLSMHVRIKVFEDLADVPPNYWKIYLFSLSTEMAAFSFSWPMIENYISINYYLKHLRGQ